MKLVWVLIAPLTKQGFGGGRVWCEDGFCTKIEKKADIQEREQASYNQLKLIFMMNTAAHHQEATEMLELSSISTALSLII